MSHRQQRIFCRKIMKQFPRHFKRANVIDVGSHDINGTNKDWMDYRPSLYLGIDIYEGRNVDYVGRAKDVLPEVWAKIRTGKLGDFDREVDTIVSTEMLEHDEQWVDSLNAMYSALRPGGLLLITAGGDGRPEHGTQLAHPYCSPATLDYYRNISNAMFSSVLPAPLFSYYFMNQDKSNCDFQFAGIKRAYSSREIYSELLNR